MSGRRGGIPGPESRTGLVRPTMTEAEFERRQAAEAQAASPIAGATGGDAEPIARIAAAPAATTRSRGVRGRTVKPRRVQRMFAIEEELDKKLWLYAIHMGRDRSDVVNDLLRPVVQSMVLYDSRDRRAGRSAESTAGDEPGAVAEAG